MSATFTLVGPENDFDDTLHFFWVVARMSWRLPSRNPDGESVAFFAGLMALMAACFRGIPVLILSCL